MGDLARIMRELRQLTDEELTQLQVEVDRQRGFTNAWGLVQLSPGGTMSLRGEGGDLDVGAPIRNRAPVAVTIAWRSSAPGQDRCPARSPMTRASCRLGLGHSTPHWWPDSALCGARCPACGAGCSREADHNRDREHGHGSDGPGADGAHAWLT